MSNTKTYDVIIWGATGFTGRLVAEYYLKTYGASGKLKWAMAGRSQSKLESVRAELGDTSVPLIVADSHDRPSLDAMVAQTKVICTTVGPYAQYGNELVDSCVQHGVHYCDLAGETQWIRRMIDTHHEKAKETGARIVHCCGFDSIPSDLGVYFMQRESQSRKGEYLQHVKMRVKHLKGGMSGGTLASLNGALAEAAADPQIKKLMNNPYGLNPKGQDNGPDKPDLQAVIYDKDLDAWIMPFIMAAINTRVVRRSNALLDFKYGKDFRYDECMIGGKGFKGKLKGYGMIAMLVALTVGKPGGLYKKALGLVLPDQGEGPSKEERESGFYNFTVVGKYANGEKMIGRITGDRDPGYGSTSKMLGEAAACLAMDQDKLPEVSGVITPSVAMGDALLERLEANAGLSFSIV